MSTPHEEQLDIVRQLIDVRLPEVSTERRSELASQIAELKGNSVLRAYDVGLETIRKSGAGRHIETMGELYLEDGKFESAVIFKRIP